MWFCRCWLMTLARNRCRSSAPVYKFGVEKWLGAQGVPKSGPSTAILCADLPNGQAIASPSGASGTPVKTVIRGALLIRGRRVFGRC
jgi:hypothetical protein